jgi:aldose sugar dehydrogenase
MPRRIGRTVAALAALVATACGAPDPAPPDAAAAVAGTPAPAPGAAPTSRTDIPQLRVSTVAGGLSHVWDMGVLPDGRMLVTERDGRLALLSRTSEGASVSPIAADFTDLLARGEGGLMGMVVHPDFARSRRFTTCQTHTDSGRPVDVRLITGALSSDGTRADRVVDPLVGGLPINPSGRHSGCRPTLAADGTLLVGTGDTARGALPQDLGSLGGKVLRVDLVTGRPAEGNPFAGSPVYTFGHRNVQGVAVRPRDGVVYTAEHGPTTDDEVNRLRPGGNYGWDPAQGGTVGGYDESVPMTDTHRYPEAITAAWRSGRPVEAVSGAAFVSGAQWGGLDGRLAVAALRGSKLLLMTLGADGAVSAVDVPAQLDDTFGRLRAVRTGPDGALFVSTSNGDDDKVLRIDPA